MNNNGKLFTWVWIAVIISVTLSIVIVISILKTMSPDLFISSPEEKMSVSGPVIDSHKVWLDDNTIPYNENLPNEQGQVRQRVEEILSGSGSTEQ